MDMTGPKTGAETAADRRRERSPAGEEELRFIRNFHDVFLSIGLGLFAAGAAFVTALLLFENLALRELDDFRAAGWAIAGAAFANAGLMWVLAEVFARTRRLFLPAIVILIAFTAFFAWGVASAYATTFGERGIDSVEAAFEQLRLMPLTVGGLTSLAVFAYYLRMKLPFAMGLTGAMVAATGLAGLYYLDAERALALGPWAPLAAGLFMFLLGVAFDARDPARTTRYSDNGFWLHFFAAPIIFSSVIALVVGGGEFFEDGASSANAAAATLGVVFAFAIISLLINRRALLVSGLLSAAVAVGVLVGNTGLSGAWTGALTLLLLGGAMVLLGGAWHTVRRLLVAPVPKTGLIARIIPPELDPEDQGPEDQGPQDERAEMAAAARA